METIVDYIVVGQGLAGSCLVVQLMKRNKKFVVFDLPEKNISSRIAAGIFNPVTGMNWVKTWKADTLFPYMRKFFYEVENTFGNRVFHERSIYRPFQSLDMQNDWMAKSSDPLYLPYIKSISTNPIDDQIVFNPLGGLELNFGGYVDIPAFLDTVRSQLVLRSNIEFSFFDETKIHHNNEKIGYENYLANKIVFCQGTELTTRSVWGYLPFKPVKGEILTLAVKEKYEKILNMGVFVLPAKDGKWKSGATYDFHNINLDLTENGKNQILNKLNRFFLPKFEVIGHVVGIRPATLDRRPFIGRHPDIKNIVIFNGLGAKGVTLAPYFSEILLDFLEYNEELEKEINVDRYHK